MKNKTSVMMKYYCLSLLLCFMDTQAFGMGNDNKVFLNLDQSFESKQPINDLLKATPDRYYVILSTHDRMKSDDPRINSEAGHAWVIWAHENPKTLASEVSGYGFWPDYNQIKINTGASEKMAPKFVAAAAIPAFLVSVTAPGRLFKAALKENGQEVINGMPGELRRDLFESYYTPSIKQVVIEVDQTIYFQSMNVLNQYKASNLQYELTGNDCLTFLIKVGEAIGFDMPERELLSNLPARYMDGFMKKLLTPGKISLHYQFKSMLIKKYGSASANFNGVYNVQFGINEVNVNSCELDFAGNRLEKKIRENTLKCSRTNYWNGDSWYQEYEAKPIPIEHRDIPGLLPNKPISEYRFSNGNVVLFYDPSSFNPSLVNMNLAKDNIKYNGAINSKGEPNGRGSITYFDKSGQYLTVREGKFIDGKFSEHVGIPFEKGILYGDLVNGLLSGRARIEYSNNTVFTGEYVNGWANGEGTFVNNNTGEYLSGHFVNGVANGLCTFKNLTGTYKGNFADGLACGEGTSWESSGVIYQGRFEKGRLANGKMTLPNGISFIGSFDAMGNPGSGKYFSKEGKEITEKESFIGDIERNKEKNGLLGIKIGDGPWEFRENQGRK